MFSKSDKAIAAAVGPWIAAAAIWGIERLGGDMPADAETYLTAAVVSLITAGLVWLWPNRTAGAAAGGVR